MTRSPLVSILAVLFSTALAAQTTSRYWVTPRGAEFEEGHAASAVQFGFSNTYTESRTQQIDKGPIGFKLPVLIKAIGWRRDGNKPAPAIKRTAELEVLMAHSDFAKAGNTFSYNYKGTPITCFRRKKVNLPDWSVMPVVKPTTFDLILPFDMPFIYNTKDALLYELVVRNLSSATAYHMDFYRDNQLNHGFGAWPTPTGDGCITANGEMVQSCLARADATGLELMFRLWGAPAGAQVFAVIGASDPKLTVPGLCGTLHAKPLLFLPVATASATGGVPPKRVAGAPWSALYIGAAFYTQCLALDPTLPYGVALSSAQACPAPSTTVKSSLPTHLVWNYKSASASTGYLDRLTCVPTLFRY